jgi:serine/threonine protein kinase
MVKQCAGIAEALTLIHDIGYAGGEEGTLYRRYGDIRPENILWFPHHENEREPGLGNLVITNACAMMRTRHSRSSDDLRDVARTGTYAAPELALLDGTVNRYADIWSLGCVYLEFIVWYLGGSELVDEFSTRRLTKDPSLRGFLTDHFYRIVQEDKTFVTTINPAVTEVSRS